MNKVIAMFIVLSCILSAGCTKDNTTSQEKPGPTEEPGNGNVTLKKGLKVICLGNSVTVQEYKPDAGWYSSWGMAASKEENDYCHRLESLLGEVYVDTEVTPLNISDWERNPSMDLNKRLDRYCDGKDVIIIRLGENMSDADSFRSSIRKLVQYCKGQAQHVLLTGSLWKDEGKEAAIRDIADGFGIPYVSLEGIDVPENRRAAGDLLYDTDGNSYEATQELLSYPNDKGMERIAETISEKLYDYLEEEEQSPSYEAYSFTLDNPQTFVFLPASRTATGRAVVVCPGGGYGYCEPTDNYEGNGWAPFFNERGIALIVVKYTLPKGNCTLPIADAEETLRRVREHSEEWHINRNDIGIMGFSAGGHLASTIATHSTGDAHPDFQILFYPVITMGDGTHQGSRDNFLGKNPSAAQIELYSNEKQVTADTPHAFIAFTEDDTLVPPAANGKAYFQALTDKGIPVTLVSWPSSSGWPAGHGWGNFSNFVHHEELMSRLSDWLDTF